MSKFRQVYLFKPNFLIHWSLDLKKVSVFAYFKSSTSMDVSECRQSALLLRYYSTFQSTTAIPSGPSFKTSAVRGIKSSYIKSGSQCNIKNVIGKTIQTISSIFENIYSSRFPFSKVIHTSQIST